MTNDLSARCAVALRDALRSGEVSPVEVLDAHLAAIAVQNPKFNAIVTLVEDQARASIAALPAAGAQSMPLYGLPVVIKDVTLTKGIRTTFGSPAYKDYVPDEDAAVVERLRKAGAIILGKTNTPEFATGANTVNALFGATRNPWNPELSPAGSSGGSAVAVATGMVPLAQGTDFGCSIRIPAAFCGIVGVRTTGGLIPNRGMRLPWDGGQVHGPLARSAEDAALMLDGMTGLDPLWPISAAPPWRSALDIVQRFDNAKGLRIAYVSDIAGFGVDKEIDDICRAAVLRLERDGAAVEEVAFSAADGFAPYKVLRGEWMVGQQFERLDMLDRFGPNLGGNVRDGLKLTVRDTAAAENMREKVWRTFCDLFGKYDYLITPAAPVPPYPLTKDFPDEVGGHTLDNYIDWIAPAFLVTLVGFPAASVPGGKTASGLPVGLQIVGPRFSEPQLLGLSKLVQAANPVGWPTYA
ncbi:amidase [Pseudorhodoplanes sp.]|uniref:amidase n=1 Tax=Pseudorhodoplanes sp. TaxID=1934341 RepID=UPI00391B53A7